jgi:predicted dithiol-disulfide oxidoreductase (DUF899 family)
MVAVQKHYAFDAPGGPVMQLDLFEGRRQLIVYHFMLARTSAAIPMRAASAAGFLSTRLGISLICTPAILRLP